MEINLFLRKINQEMIDVGNDLRRPNLEDRFQRLPVESCCIYASWKKSCCVIDFSFERPGDRVVRPMAGGLVMRAEDVGGMIWNPTTGEVYKADEEAYHTILELDRGLSELEVARRVGVKVEQVQDLSRKLEALVR